MGKFLDSIEPEIAVGVIFTIFFGIMFGIGIGGDRFLDLTAISATYTLGKAGWNKIKNGSK